jgi:phosphatidylserine/phosphatidylglycerophosphate/cardiolipin synthase-like enzyme
LTHQLTTSGDIFVLKRFSVALLTIVLLVGSGATTAAASAYTPEPGAAFNNPWGGRVQRNALAIKLRRTIDSTPRGEVIKIAVYSFNRRDIGDALTRACRRNVAVQIVINDNWISGQVRRMQRLLGSDIDPHYGDACHPRTASSGRPPYAEPSFIKVCYRSCRYGAGNQHDKIYMFSRAGRARNVIMFGSNNLATYAANVHWNDLFTLVEKPGFFAAYSEIMRQLAEDRRVAQPYSVSTEGDLVTEFGPLVGASRAQDPIAQRLAQVGCRAPAGYGRNGHTIVRITMYSWNGDRGRYLAKRVADLARRGCIVRALLSGGGPHIRTILRNGGAVLRTPDFDTDDDRETGFGETPWEHFTHEKWMTLDGTWAGGPTRIVWTGSENWSDQSLHNDEMTVRIPRNGAYRAYAKHFAFVWDNYSRPIGHR